MIKAVSRYSLSILLALGALAVWQLVTFLFSIQRWLLPSPWDVLRALVSSRSLIIRHTWVTVEEALVGFAIAVLVGFAIAVVIVNWRLAERALYPYVIASQAVPIIAIAPVLVVWFGFGLLPKVIVIVLITFFPVAINTVDGLRKVDSEMITLMRSLGATRWQIFRMIELPSAMPSFFSGAKIASAISVIGAILGEWVGASEGLGYLITRSSAQYLTARVFAVILILSVLGIFLFYMVSYIERLMTPWARRQPLANNTKTDWEGVDASQIPRTL
ncbi:ABC transporter permease [Dehalococcoidia bacterium]|nr:ABC transporter permease [Dehalococcoidia bacterium]